MFNLNNVEREGETVCKCSKEVYTFMYNAKNPAHAN